MSAPPTERDRSLWHAIGPGVLFAGAAVGVSHLVQSTRAGAAHGLTLIAFVLLANLVKYPAFRLGPQYAAATGTSMLEGYRRRGRGALALYALVTFATMFTVQAAVTFVTAGLFLHLLGLDFSPVLASAALFALCLGLLRVGQYGWLDRVVKLAVAVFTLATLAATALALPRVDWGGPWWPAFGTWQITDWLFLAALIGWMPSAIDVSIWQSLWTLARARDAGRLPSVRAALVDFHVGYVGTALLALCFLLLGAAVIHGQAVAVPPQAVGFAALLVRLYSETLGEWAGPLIGAAAFLVMFSTTLTVVDGFPRALSVLVERARGPETPVDPDAPAPARLEREYWAAAALLAIGSLAILAFASGSLKALVDFATTASFLTAPVLAWLNHRAITGEEVPAEGRPGAAFLAASWGGIVAQAAIASYWVWLLMEG